MEKKTVYVIKDSKKKAAMQRFIDDNLSNAYAGYEEMKRAARQVDNEAEVFRDKGINLGIECYEIKNRVPEEVLSGFRVVDKKEGDLFRLGKVGLSVIDPFKEGKK